MKTRYKLNRHFRNTSDILFNRDDVISSKVVKGKYFIRKYRYYNEPVVEMHLLQPDEAYDGWYLSIELCFRKLYEF